MVIDTWYPKIKKCVNILPSCTFMWHQYKYKTKSSTIEWANNGELFFASFQVRPIWPCYFFFLKVRQNQNILNFQDSPLTTFSFFRLTPVIMAHWLRLKPVWSQYYHFNVQCVKTLIISGKSKQLFFWRCCLYTLP